MKLQSVRVQNYKSILDSGLVEIEEKITTMVGMTEAGKSSFLKMLSGVDKNQIFQENELPYGSDISQKFTNTDVAAKDILQLTATYTIEESDRDILPPEYKNITGVVVERYFDGHFSIKPIGNYSEVSLNLQKDIETINQILSILISNFDAAVPRLGNLAPFKENLLKNIDNFNQSDFANLKDVDISIQTLNNTVNTLPKDPQFQNELNQRVNELNNARKNLANSIAENPLNKLYEIIPKPLYKDNVFKLEGKIPIDEFIANPQKSKTFHCLAIVGGLNSVGVQKIRHKESAARNSYFDVISKALSEQLNSFWTQEHYDFKLGIKETDLVFNVVDKTTGKETSVTERSEGFKWWTAFFLDLSLSRAIGTGTSIILLDNPATELHDEGKGDVQKFLTKVTNNGKLQIIYATHERALIDPWRIERIRIVEKKPEGTKIEKVRSNTRGDLMNKIRRNIGSPAKYSLFGAPQTINFEGISDMHFFSAFNEFFEQINLEYLNKDSYSINALDSMNEAPISCKLYKNLGFNFVIIVDSGQKTRDMIKKLESDDYSKFFIEIKQITGTDECDIEDMIAPDLYYEVFKKAYEKILDEVPPIEKIEKNNNDKRVTKYSDWFKSKGDVGEFNKTLVAYQMFDVLMSKKENEINSTPIKKTCDNFLKLMHAIQDKFQKDADA